MLYLPIRVSSCITDTPFSLSQKKVGAWNYYQLEAGLEGMAIGCLARTPGKEKEWSQEEIIVLCARARAEMKDPAVHGLFYLYVSPFFCLAYSVVHLILIGTLLATSSTARSPRKNRGGMIYFPIYLIQLLVSTLQAMLELDLCLMCYDMMMRVLLSAFNLSFSPVWIWILIADYIAVPPYICCQRVLWIIVAIIGVLRIQIHVFLSIITVVIICIYHRDTVERLVHRRIIKIQ